MPRIAISVDMLDTGIDVRELVNLVLQNQFTATPSFGK
jgi:type I site-specific restriction endonuclease